MLKGVRQRIREGLRILCLTTFTIYSSRFKVHFSRSVWAKRRDSISGHLWYGLRTNLRLGYELIYDCAFPRRGNPLFQVYHTTKK